MARPAGHRYPRRTRNRALELSYCEDADRSPSEIAAELRTEGHGDVSVSAISRWRREDPAHIAKKALALCRSLRQQAAAASRGYDAYCRLIAAGSEVGDLFAMASERIEAALPGMKLRTPDDLARITATYSALVIAGVESHRLIAEIRNLAPVEAFVSPCGHA